MNKYSVEGFDNASDYAALAKVFSDLELQAYLSSPATSTDTLANNIQRTTAVILSEKNNMMNSLSDDIATADTNVVNTAYYLSRSKDLLNLASDVNRVASGQLDTASINQKLTARQNEINEWSNYSKLEVLYFMQVIFISLSLFALLAYLVSISYISSSLFWTIVSIVSIIDLLIILLKSRFTMIYRDGRYWHKMRFASQPHKDSSSSK